jgi:pantoate--beta-alanine ligase
MSVADTTSLVIVRDVDSLRQRVALWRRERLRVALVPTMGALHRGHKALMTRGLELADRVVATIFVNPTQFAPAEDFGSYPRKEAADVRLLNEAGVHLLFAPEVATMYPPGFSTQVRVNGLSSILEGAHRPTHFDGVATVVTKLLLQAAPDVALFGEKDYQQLCVIKRLASDLDIEAKIVGVPTVREADGLALSSRNAYLTEEERKIAPALHQAITDAATTIAKGANAEAALKTAKERVLAAGFPEVDYIEARQAETLAPFEGGAGRVLAAARLGRARLIDNVAFG